MSSWAWKPPVYSPVGVGNGIDSYSSRKMLCESEIMARGWTKGLIDKFLGKPDKLTTNPKYRRAAPMRLYYLTRVEAVEKSDEFKSAKVMANRQSVASAKAAEARRTKLLAEIAADKVTVPVFDESTLLDKAICGYNSRFRRRRKSRDCVPASKDSDDAFLQRIQVNYLRHELTDYDADLDSVYRRVGAGNARPAIRCNVLDAIAEAYPKLQEECERQKRNRAEVLP